MQKRNKAALVYWREKGEWIDGMGCLFSGRLQHHAVHSAIFECELIRSKSNFLLPSWIRSVIFQLKYEFKIS
jgi:hypothetical protein